jgi:NAD(P)H-nitrite reductase large subunit
MNREDTVVCRCVEISEGEIRNAVRDGARTFDAVKKVTRAGMGLCQGRTCVQLVERLIAEETGCRIADLPVVSVRFPTKPVRLELIAGMEI